MRPTLLALETYLAANLPGMVQTVATEWSVTLPAPAYIGIVENMGAQLPSVEILPDYTDTQYQAESAPHEWGFETHQVNVVITHIGLDAENVQDTVLGFREAVRRLVKADNTFGDKFNRVRLSGCDFSAMIRLKKEGKLLKAISQRLQCREVY